MERFAVDPIPMELPGTEGRTSWAYLIHDGAGSLHLVDCGADSEVNFAALESAIRRCGRSITDLTSMIGTHAHYDHIGMAARLRRETGAAIMLHATDAASVHEGRTYGGDDFLATVERWGVPAERRPEIVAAATRKVAAGEPVVVDRELADGDRLGIPGWDLRVLATPGHTPGHLCVVDADRSVAFVGDHVLSDQNPGAGLGGASATNAIDDYLASLDRLEATGARRLLPGHAEVVFDPAHRIGQLRERHLARRAEIAATARDNDTVWEVASRLSWSGGWNALHAVRLYSALNQVDLHRAALTATPTP